MRNALIIPARSGDVSGQHAMLQLASERLPLDKLECHFDQLGVDVCGSGFVYTVPQGKEIHAIVHGDNPGVETIEFVGQALTYTARNLRPGTSAHGEPMPYEPDLPGYIFHRDAWAREERQRPSVGVTVYGNPSARVTVGGEERTLDMDGQKTYFVEEQQVFEIEADRIGVGDIEDIEISVRDATASGAVSEIEVPNFEPMHWIKTQLWRPGRPLELPDTAERQLAEIVDSHPEIGDDPDAMERIRRAIFHKNRSKGYLLSDDPYPRSRKLQYATVTDAKGENGRLYSPFEGLQREETYVSELHLIGGSAVKVRTMNQEEHARRQVLNMLFEDTGWSEVRP